MTYNCIYPLWFFPLSWEGEQGFKKQRPAYLCQILPVANTAVPNCFIESEEFQWNTTSPSHLFAMGKQCFTQWDLKWNVSFGSWTGLFGLAWYAEKLGLLNGCDELALLVKWMPMRLSPVHVSWTYEAVSSLVSKICAPRRRRECSAFSCCAGTVLSEMRGVGQVAEEEF